MSTIEEHVEHTEDKIIYHIFPKEDPNSIIQFTKGRDDLFELVDVGTHILVVLEEWENEYGREGETRFFSSDEHEELDEWMKEKKEESILRFEIQEGTLIHAWGMNNDNMRDSKWDSVVGGSVVVFIVLGPIWFLLAVIFGYLYFF